MRRQMLVVDLSGKNYCDSHFYVCDRQRTLVRGGSREISDQFLIARVYNMPALCLRRTCEETTNV